MNETQLLTTALATVPTVVVVLVGILVNNSRLSDLRADLNLRITELRSDLGARIGDVGLRLNDQRDVLRAEMGKNQSELLMKFADLDRRLIHLESNLGLK